MKNPDPISEWSQDEIGNWLRGLDGGLDKYKEALKYATGEQLLQARYNDLLEYGVNKIGHQEAILDAVLLLDETVREIRYGTLRATAKKLAEKCLKLQHLRNPTERTIGSWDPVNGAQLSNKHFELALEVLAGVRQLIGHLQAYNQNGYGGRVIQGHHQDHAHLAKLALELSRTALQPLPAWASLEPISNCCFELCQLASRIQFSQYADERPLVESVTIRRNQEFSLGLFLKMRQDDGRLEITGTKDGADAIGKVYAGDELIAINDQIVVGWSLANVVTLLRSCRACQAQCEGSCSDYDATLLIKRSFVNAEFSRSNPIMHKNLYDSRSRSTPDVNHIPTMNRHHERQRSQHHQNPIIPTGGAGPPSLTNQLLMSRAPPSEHSTHERRKPRLSLPPPPSEPYRPKRPQSMDISSQRAHSLGNLTGSESPNSLMDAATYAAAHNGSLQSFGNGTEMHLYPQPVYEERPREHNTQQRNSSRCTSGDDLNERLGCQSDSQPSRLTNRTLSSTVDSVESNGTGEETEDPSDTEQALIEKLKSSSITPNSSLPRRTLNTHSVGGGGDFRVFENHSRQNSAASVGRDSRLSHTGTNNSVYSNLSEHSNLSISQDKLKPLETTLDEVSKTKSQLNDIRPASKSFYWNNFNNSNKAVSRCRSEPRLAPAQSVENLESRKPMKAFLWQKDLTKNILKSKWNKYWAVLQDCTLYIYSDQKEMTTIQEPLILYGQKVGAPEAKCTKKHSFRLTGSRCDVLLAAETNEQRQRWMSALQFAATGYKEISSNAERRSGPDLTKITTGPIVMRRDQSPLQEKASPMSHKSLSVENINKLKPVLMKNINLDKKSSSGLTTDILNVWRETLKGDSEKETKPGQRPKSFLESDF